MTATAIDWYDWHADYEEPDSILSHRLAWVQQQLRHALDQLPEGPVRVVVLCAGQGRDIAGVLKDHARAPDVSGRIVELDPRNTATATRLLAQAGAGDRIEVVTGDAAQSDAYAGAVPADLIVAVGIFGNIVDADAEKLIKHLPGLSAPGARVLWSRGIKKADLNPQIRGWLKDAGFEEVIWELLDGTMGLGVNRYAGQPGPLPSGVQLFNFVGHDSL
jgi:Putative methyltransferase